MIVLRIPPLSGFQNFGDDLLTLRCEMLLLNFRSDLLSGGELIGRVCEDRRAVFYGGVSSEEDTG